MCNYVDIMDGMFAYDTGCVSSGIKNDLLKNKFILDKELTFKTANALLKQYLSQEQYTIEDAKTFIDWVEKELGFDI